MNLSCIGKSAKSSSRTEWVTLESNLMMTLSPIEVSASLNAYCSPSSKVMNSYCGTFDEAIRSPFIFNTMVAVDTDLAKQVPV